jgi:hypothetical protein
MEAMREGRIGRKLQPGWKVPHLISPCGRRNPYYNGIGDFANLWAADGGGSMIKAISRTSGGG